jgi:DNA-binding MarR family transcriptional regulator
VTATKTHQMALTEESAALGLLLRAHRVLLDEVERRLRDEVGLSIPLWEVLVVLARAEGHRLRMVDVTRRMCVSKSNVTQLIDKLEQQALVTRETSLTDRRLVYAMLSDRGQQATERGTEVFNDAAKEYFARFITKEEIEKISSGLSKVISELEPESIEPAQVDS